MTYACQVLADSLSPAGVRLTTLQVTFPRIVLAEFNTYRVFSRNSASSRAIPVEKRIQAVQENPFVPESFGKNQKGMQASEEVADQAMARAAWMTACRQAIEQAKKLAELGVHKQLANRLLEPFSWHTVIVTATEWDNFFAQRCHPDAQPEIQRPALLMREAMAASNPVLVPYGSWHTPLIVEPNMPLPPNDQSWPYYVKLSVARCARVSYLTHDGKRDPAADLQLYDRLVASGHMSPLEHAARPMAPAERSIGGFCGNFRGWVQHRKEIAGEGVFKAEP